MLFLVSVHSHIGNFDLAIIGDVHLIQNGGNHFTGPAPSGPKVYQYWLGSLRYIVFKTGAGNVIDSVVTHNLWSPNLNICRKRPAPSRWVEHIRRAGPRARKR